MKNVIIIGAGGFGRELYWWVKSSLCPKQYKLKGFLDDEAFKNPEFNHEFPVLSTINNYKISKEDIFLIAIGNVSIKKNIVQRMKSRGAKFLTFIHDTSIVASTATIGEGVILCPYTLVNDNAKINDFAMMHMFSSVGHDVFVGKYSILSPYAIATGFAQLGEEVFLATHSTVAPSKKVGNRVQVSANCAVLKNVKDDYLVYNRNTEYYHYGVRFEKYN